MKFNIPPLAVTNKCYRLKLCESKFSNTPERSFSELVATFLWLLWNLYRYDLIYKCGLHALVFFNLQVMPNSEADRLGLQEADQVWIYDSSLLGMRCTVSFVYNCVACIWHFKVYFVAKNYIWWSYICLFFPGFVCFFAILLAHEWFKLKLANQFLPLEAWVWHPSGI